MKLKKGDFVKDGHGKIYRISSIDGTTITAAPKQSKGYGGPVTLHSTKVTKVDNVNESNSDYWMKNRKDQYDRVGSMMDAPSNPKGNLIQVLDGDPSKTKKSGSKIKVLGWERDKDNPKGVAKKYGMRKAKIMKHPVDKRDYWLVEGELNESKVKKYKISDKEGMLGALQHKRGKAMYGVHGTLPFKFGDTVKYNGKPYVVYDYERNINAKDGIYIILVDKQFTHQLNGVDVSSINEGINELDTTIYGGGVNFSQLKTGEKFKFNPKDDEVLIKVSATKYKHSSGKGPFTTGKKSGVYPVNESLELDEKAKSEIQQQAAGAALAAKRGEIPASELTGASKRMYDDMSEDQLEDFAGTKHDNVPTKVEENIDILEECAKRFKHIIDRIK